MDEQTRKQWMWADHEKQWAPVWHDPNGRVQKPATRKQLVAILRTVEGMVQTQWAPGMVSSSWSVQLEEDN